jgi:hypothetical protein
MIVVRSFRHRFARSKTFKIAAPDDLLEQKKPIFSSDKISMLPMQ